MKAFIESQFAYCPLVWMFCSRSSNNPINHLHKRELRIVCNDHSSTFEDLLEKDNSASIHHRNIRLLAIQLYKAQLILLNSSQLILELFQRRSQASKCIILSFFCKFGYQNETFGNYYVALKKHKNTWRQKFCTLKLGKLGFTLGRVSYGQKIQFFRIFANFTQF